MHRRDIGVFGGRVPLHGNALAYMHHDVSAKRLSLLRQGDLGVDWIFEIFFNCGRQHIFDVATKGLANVKLLTLYG